MNYLTDLTKEELKYICSVIPFQLAVDYFRRYPKEFTKLRPGFRVKSLNEEAVKRTLYDFRNKDFIASFLIKSIDKWIKEIDEELDKRLANGIGQEAAYIDVLSQSFFAENIALYYKIKGIEKTEEYFSVLSAAVLYQNTIFKTDYDSLNQVKKKLSETEKKLENLTEQFTEQENKAAMLRKKHSELKTKYEEKNLLAEQKQSELASLIQVKSEIENKLKTTEDSYARWASESNHKIEILTSKTEAYKNQISVYESDIDNYKKEIDEYKTKLIVSEETAEAFRLQSEKCEERIAQLRIEKTNKISENATLQSRIHELEAENENLANRTVQLTEEKEERKKAGEHILPMRPVDMDDFDEYFGYNLTNIGFDESVEGGKAFVTYLENIIFDGIPVLIKRGPGLNLANCLSNTLYGDSMAKVISYSERTGIQQLNEILALASERVICIDGFVGNCNESELVSVLQEHRNKIIFLTYMYDKTLSYIPYEFLAYVRYLNVDEFSSLLVVKDISEDPSEIKEDIYAYQRAFTENRYQKIFQEIAQECGLGKDTVNALKHEIEDELYMNNLLMFTLLPYVKKTLRVDPFNCSKRLQKYAGESGRCPNKETIMRWFG